jgi:hypothetical protein
MTEKIQIKAGEKKQIFSRSFSSIPIKYEFQAYPFGSNRLEGEVEVITTQIFFRQQPKLFPLRETNIVKAGLWDTFIKIYVTANRDLEITIPKRKFKSISLLMLLTALIVLAALSIIIIRLFV